jgi:hypothetical protein
MTQTSEKAKPVLLLFGNCQGQMIQSVLAESNTIDSAVRLEQFPSWTLHSAAEWDQMASEYLNDTVVLWEQVESDVPDAIKEANKAELSRRLPSGCRIIRYPGFYFRGLWPFYCEDSRQKHEPFYPNFRYPFGDSVARLLADADLSDDLLFEKYMEQSRASMPDLDQKLEWDERRLDVLDKECDVKCRDYILGNFRSSRLFYDPQHCSAMPLAFVTSRMVEQTLAGRWLDGAAALSELTDMFGKLRAQNPHEMPIHPEVIRHFGLSYVTDESHYQWEAHSWNFRQYIVKYIRYADYCRLE